MTYAFDLDGTLCETEAGNYEAAVPIPERIAHVNALFDEGHTIYIHTARGSVTGRKWRAMTIGQLKRWGVKHHVLIMGKPFAHVYVDDRAVNAHRYGWGA